MIFSTNSLIANYMYYYPIKVFIIVFIFLLWFCIYKLFKYKVSIDYKIYKPWLNCLAIILYIYLYIIYILILRYLAWGKSVSLKSIYILIQTQLVNYGILYIMFLLSLLILCFICLIRIRTVLTKELIKRHIWLLYYNRQTDTKYEKYLRKFANKYSYRELYFKFLIYYRPLLIKLLTYTEKISYKSLNKLLENIFSNNLLEKLKYIPLIVLLLLIIYDCYFNAWVITKIFYYLPFYMLFNIWYKVSQFLCNNNNMFNRIIYERYYCLDIILYSNTTDEEEERLEDYIRKGFKYIYTEWDMINGGEPIIRLRRFSRADQLDENGNIVFENKSQGLMFTMTKEDLQKHIDS